MDRVKYQPTDAALYRALKVLIVLAAGVVNSIPATCQQVIRIDGPNPPTVEGVDVSCSMQDEIETRDLLGRRLAKQNSMWDCAIENNSAESVQLTESAVRRKMHRLSPRDSLTIGLKLSSTQPRSLWTLAGNTAEDLTKVGAALAAAQTITVPTPLLIGATAAIAYGPAIVARIRGAAPPVAANFERVAFLNPVTLQAGQAATVHIFTRHWRDGSTFPDFTIPTAHLPLVRSAQ